MKFLCEEGEIILEEILMNVLNCSEKLSLSWPMYHYINEHEFHTVSLWNSLT